MKGMVYGFLVVLAVVMTIYFFNARQDCKKYEITAYSLFQMKEGIINGTKTVLEEIAPECFGSVKDRAVVKTALLRRLGRIILTEELEHYRRMRDADLLKKNKEFKGGEKEAEEEVIRIAKERISREIMK